jgi:DNA-3-methyladenine glycosylase II
VRAKPGLRVPGAWDGFELAVRSVLGQQVSLKGATTLSGRFVARFGERSDIAEDWRPWRACAAMLLWTCKLLDTGEPGVVHERPCDGPDWRSSAPGRSSGCG